MKKRLLSILLCIALTLCSISFVSFATDTKYSNFSNDVITVTVTIKTQNEYWIDKYPVTVTKEGATVYHAFVKACAENNIKQDGASNGYVASMSKDNIEAAEFTSGPESGWLYNVNGKAPDTGLTEYPISNGDDIEWYYTNYDFSGGVTDKVNLNEIIADTAECLIQAVPQPAVSQVGGEWLILGLARSGYSLPLGYLEKYLSSAKSYIAEKKGILHTRKYTEYARLSLALSALGNDPRNLSGYNILSPLADYENVILQGTNGVAFALIALDCNEYEIPTSSNVNTPATRHMYIDFILNAQNKDGGFALTAGSVSDTDITAMALQALSPYSNEASVRSAIDSAVMYLSNNQNNDGGFVSKYSDSSESTAQVLTALSALNIPATDSRFTKDGNTVLDNLLSFYTKGNGFTHTKDSTELNLMATEQALCALVAYKRMLDGNCSIYDMRDVTGAVHTGTSSDFGLADKDENISYIPIINPEKTFYDITNNEFKLEIEALASRGIINGKTDSAYCPDHAMTRAEFATIVTRSLGLPSVSGKIFDDVTEDTWYYSYVTTAHKFGIVKGVSKTHFNPEGTITREEALIMLARCAKLCGNSTDINAEQARNILAQFDDYTEFSDWALSSAAYCVKAGILYDDTLEIKPKEFVKRDEIAYMLYNLIKISNLL